jgi:predicted Fe-Mo cluster-binding NifX family protein
MELKFAFALNSDRIFEKKHFGEAETFAIYKTSENRLVLTELIQNQFREMDENGQHGLTKKGLAITDKLKKKDVKILVSMQFGKNIRVVNQHFIPVIIEEEKPEDVVPILEKHLEWLKDELGNKPGNFMLFTIKNGIFKSQINPN